MKAFVVIVGMLLARCAPAGAGRRDRGTSSRGAESLLTCMPEPRAREVWHTQREVALFLVKLAEAGEDCRAKPGGVRSLLESQAVK